MFDINKGQLSIEGENLVAFADEYAHKILEALAVAYGGHSQYDERDAGKALRGHIRNGALQYQNRETHMAVAMKMAAIMADRWGTHFAIRLIQIGVQEAAGLR